MLTREEAIRRLENIAQEIVELKEAFERDWRELSPPNATQAFLEKCGGWEDTRSVQEIIRDIDAARSDYPEWVAVC